jgi:hypothetical protein
MAAVLPSPHVGLQEALELTRRLTMLKALLMALALAAVSIPGYLDAQAVTTSSVPYSTPNRGASTIQTQGVPSTLVVGYGRAQPTVSTTPTGVALLDFTQNNVLISETGVSGTAAITAGRTYAEVNGPISTAVAFANTNSSAVVVTFSFTDQFGTDSGQKTFPINANAQIAKFLTEAPFNLPSGFVGTLTFASSAPIGVVAMRTLLNERAEFLMTTQPVLTLPSNVSGGPLPLGHFADGGGWKTNVLLINTTDATLTGVVEFFGEGTAGVAAAPLTLRVNGVVAASFSYTIRPRASAAFETSGPVGSVTQVGSVRITPTGGTNAPAAFAVFSFSSNGVTVSQTTVQAQAPATALRSYVEINSITPVPQAIQTAVAVTNNSSTPATVNFELLQLDGASTNLVTSIIVPPFGHAARFVQELFQLSPTINPTFDVPFRGMLRITSFSSISVVALRTRYNQLGNFLITTTPVSNEAASASIAELVFPQIVDGGGYTTQFVLFSGISNQSTTGVLSFVGQDGQALNLTVR